jgi:histidinol-phosphate/aromatic aminotransferase/cobyric acid decarboxylase-like protein
LAIVLSKRVQKVKPSPTLAVTARAAKLKAEGKDIIGLGAGEPDFDTPVHIADAGVDAIRKGITRYTAVDGTAELKDAIIAKFKRENGLTYERSQILVSSGAKQTCFNACAALLDPGDECVIPAPYWVSYPDMALLADGLPIAVYAGASQGYKITPAQLAAAITPRTKLFIINSPCNPTGAAYTKAELQALGEVLAPHPQIVIASDEMYEHIYWAAEPYTSFAQANPKLYERTITINGVSKAYAMTGWRIGVQCVEHFAARRHSCLERRPVLCRRNEPGIQGASRLRGRRTECHSRSIVPARRRYLLCLCADRRRHAHTGLEGRQRVCRVFIGAGRCRRCTRIRFRRTESHAALLCMQHGDTRGRTASHQASLDAGGREARVRLWGTIEI